MDRDRTGTCLELKQCSEDGFEHWESRLETARSHHRSHMKYLPQPINTLSYNTQELIVCISMSVAAIPAHGGQRPPVAWVRRVVAATSRSRSMTIRIESQLPVKRMHAFKMTSRSYRHYSPATAACPLHSKKISATLSSHDAFDLHLTRPQHVRSPS